MKKSVFVGLCLVCFSLVYPFSVGGGILRIDVIPTFLGFLLIAVGMDKMPYENRRLREVRAFASGLTVVSFLLFIGSLSPLHGLLIYSATGENTPFWHGILDFLGNVNNVFENTALCVYMIFIAYFCFAVGTEINKRLASAPTGFRGSTRDAYGDPLFSRSYLRRTKILTSVFCAVYIALAVLYAFNQLYALAHRADTGAVRGLCVIFYDFEFGLWAFLIPVHAAFAAVANRAVNVCGQPRPVMT